ncbi:hypothetical protein PAPHI01_1584 [Pancytospora philotis]|nr:hypothetical protein PAPHI01_1584 [Pancytospora philotis]
MQCPKLQEIKPLLGLAEAFHGSIDLIDNGVKPRITHLLLPSLAITFGPALLLNSVDGSFAAITRSSLVIYAVGLLMALYLHKSRLLLSFTAELPMVAKLLAAAELVESPDSLSAILRVRAAKFFVGMAVRKLVLHRTMKFKRADLLSFVLYHLVLYVIRLHDLPVLAVLLMVYPVPLYRRLRAFLKSRARTLKNKAKRRQPILHTPASKLPRRKASIASMLETKNKDL